MMLKVLNSGSSGNCYILESDTEALIIEAGLPFREVKKALDFNVRKIVAAICSHGHKDHSGYVGEYEKAGIPVFKPYESEAERQLRFYGGFVIKSFPLVHDVPCFGFQLFHEDSGAVIYASDTEYIKYRFKGLNHILVEANYSDDLVEHDAINREHVLRGHMSLKTALDFVSVNDNPKLRNVVLLHLSKEHADADLFRQQAERTTDKKVYIAKKGLEVDLNLCPF